MYAHGKDAEIKCGKGQMITQVYDLVIISVAKHWNTHRKVYLHLVHLTTEYI